MNVYDALRCEHFLIEHRCPGRFTRAAEGTDQARSLFLGDLTRSVAEVLVAAYPKKDSNSYAAALADARTIASCVASHKPLTPRRQNSATGSEHAYTVGP